MQRLYVALRDGEKAGEACFAGEQIVVVRIYSIGAHIVADMKEPAAGIEQEREVHGVRGGVSATGEVIEAVMKRLPGRLAFLDHRLEIVRPLPSFRR